MDVFGFIYERSKFAERYDLFRLKDMVDSFSRPQIEAKQWAVDKLYPHIGDDVDAVYILGSWYGLLAHLLANKGFTELIMNYELDDMCIEIANKMKVHENIKHTHADGLSVFEHHHTNKEGKVIVCTACEHIDREELASYLAMKHPDIVVCMQSNNMYDIDSHINCHDSLEDFVESLELDEVLYKGQMDFGKYSRYMVIGK